jgi:multicopper oxidase
MAQVGIDITDQFPKPWTGEIVQAATVQEGQRVSLTFSNMSMMWHPMHLHGHTFQVIKPGGGPRARKDTVVVLPMQRLTVDLVADNPGEWMLHCHNTYHLEAGTMTSLRYVV